MKTGRSKAETIVFKDMNTTNITSKQIKKHAPPIMTEAFGDKENVVERTHAAVSVNESTKPKMVENTSECVREKAKRVTAIENISEKRKLQENASCEGKNQITVDDLTNPSGPSENYWKLMAEEQRKALKEVSEENKMLHRKCELLETENGTLKQALQEATEVIDMLNQIIAESEATNETESEVENRNSSDDTKISPVKQHSDHVGDAFGNDSTVYDESDDSVHD